ncbi:MAG: DUF368 domain-containing protein [Alkaliphilus sp.]|nr:DUF368 domain-containing protein [Alkaliphilus sp. AH-315-G20]MBN4067836.1 DUF368 domain-containing protein [Alkaliphilus transvaalensis]MBN4069753.1 DUF368 domain-containing protein [bacterium AH-315-G05]PHS28997.1 MAG: DUF368 domain-containing protein [Alkaliphilus sp.]
MHPLVQGLILGFVIVLPGMSGGTVLVILGSYEKLISDLAKFKIKPYIPMLLGVVIGIYTGGRIFASLFVLYRDLMAAFLLGCLLASTKALLKDVAFMKARRLAFIALGLISGYYLVGDSINLSNVQTEVSWLHLIVTGAISTATMIIPGISGSAVLIIFGLYDTVLVSLKELNIANLFFFAIGALVGLFALVNLLEKVYKKHKGMLSCFFAGLIVGSSKVLLPYSINIFVILLFALGFIAVWMLSD